VRLPSKITLLNEDIVCVVLCLGFVSRIVAGMLANPIKGVSQSVLVGHAVVSTTSVICPVLHVGRSFGSLFDFLFWSHVCVVLW